MKRTWLAITIYILFFAVIYVCRAETESAEQKNIPGAETKLLNNGREIPLTGVNCSLLTPVQTENAVYLALRQGFRLIDLSENFGKEEAAGRAIRRAIDENLVTREEIFVITGIWMDESTEPELLAETADAAISQILSLLGLEYIDLILLSQNRFDIDMAFWQAMERAVESGLVHSIGLSGFSDIRNYDLFVNNAVTIQPVVLQIPIYPYQQSKDIREYLDSSGILFMTEFPLGGKQEEQILFADPIVSENATWHNKTSDQILLRWHLQSGIIAVPTAEDESKIEEYYNIYDFELSDDEMMQINALNRENTHEWYY